jgi:hypothetical protein
MIIITEQEKWDNLNAPNTDSCNKLKRLYKMEYLLKKIVFFFFWQHWGLNSGLHAC